MFYDRFKHLCDANNTTPTAVLKELNISTLKVCMAKPKFKCQADII